jgi:hypothetical protein
MLSQPPALLTLFISLGSSCLVYLVWKWAFLSYFNFIFHEIFPFWHSLVEILNMHRLTNRRAPNSISLQRGEALRGGPGGLIFWCLADFAASSVESFSYVPAIPDISSSYQRANFTSPALLSSAQKEATAWDFELKPE